MLTCLYFLTNVWLKRLVILWLNKVLRNWTKHDFETDTKLECICISIICNCNVWWRSRGVYKHLFDYETLLWSNTCREHTTSAWFGICFLLQASRNIWACSAAIHACIKTQNGSCLQYNALLVHKSIKSCTKYPSWNVMKRYVVPHKEAQLEPFCCSKIVFFWVLEKKYQKLWQTCTVLLCMLACMQYFVTKWSSKLGAVVPKTLLPYFSIDTACTLVARKSLFWIDCRIWSFVPVSKSIAVAKQYKRYQTNQTWLCTAAK